MSGGIVVLLVGVGCSIPEPNPSKVTPAGTSMRAETAIATTNAGGIQRIVTVFNDVSEKLLPATGMKDIEFASDLQSITFRRDMSIVGWATSSDGGSWSYKGKLDVPAGWEALLGDPAVAIENDNSAVVYATTLALDEAGWNAEYPGQNALSTSPKANGFCVFRSSDGGVTFSGSKCVVVGVAGDVDKTAVAVDGAGHVFVAVEDALFGVKVWRSGATWDALVQNPIHCVVGAFPECTDAVVPKDFVYAEEPRMATDTNGGVWLTTVNEASPAEIGLIRWDPNGDVDSFFDLFNWCGLPLAPQMVSGPAINVAIGTTSATQVRNAFRYSHAWGYTNITQTPAFRLAYEYNDPLGNRKLQIVELSDDYPGTLCGGPLGWNTAFDANAAGVVSTPRRTFMSALSYANKGVGVSPTQMEWYLGYMFANAAVTDPTKQYAGFALQGLRHEANSVATVQLLWPFRPVITPSDYYTCPTSATGYWGDYFGVTQIWAGSSSSWHALATITDSRPAPPCQTTGPGIGLPMQIAAGMNPPP